jgi:hypothetical protein
MMAYERSVRKKLRSLFEYLDTDRDGRITLECLLNGLSRLQEYESQAAAQTRLENHIGKQEEKYNSYDKVCAQAQGGMVLKNNLCNNFSFIDENFDLKQESQFHPQTDFYFENDIIDPHNELKEEKKFNDVMEYEVEELIRCVPNADEFGGITLQAFLASESTLLPKLSKLRLLQ